MLLDAQQVARAADLQVLERQLEPRPEVVQLGDHVQPLVGRLRMGLQRVVEEVGVGALPGAANPTPQLIQLRQSHAMGINHHDRVGVRDIQPRLDDGGTDQHIGLAADELHHHVRERGFGHLPVADHDPGLGHQPLDPLLGLLDRLHAVIDEEHLAATLELALDDLLDQVVLVGGDKGLDRQALLGRRLNHR